MAVKFTWTVETYETYKLTLTDAQALELFGTSSVTNLVDAWDMTDELAAFEDDEHRYTDYVAERSISNIEPADEPGVEPADSHFSHLITCPATGHAPSPQYRCTCPVTNDANV